MRRLLGSIFTIKNGPVSTVIEKVSQEPQFFLGCGSMVGDVVIKCTNDECATCNPMTAEKAAVINQRFLRERGYE